MNFKNPVEKGVKNVSHNEIEKLAILDFIIWLPSLQTLFFIYLFLYIFLYYYFFYSFCNALDTSGEKQESLNQQ